MRALFGTAACFLIAACSTMQVNSAQAPGANLAQYKTYDWLPQKASSAPNASVLDQTIKSAVEADLAKKGLVRDTSGNPDLLVEYTAISKDSVEYGGPVGPYALGVDYAYPVREGTLQLNFIDPKTNKSVWQGTAADTIGDSGASQDQVKEAVAKLIDRYPKA